MDYTTRMKDLRTERHMTQTQIARLLYVGQRTYSDYETGKTRVTVETFIHLAQIFDVSLDYLAGITEERGHYPKK